LIFHAVKVSGSGSIPETVSGHGREKKSPRCRGYVTILSHLKPSIYPRRCGRFSPCSLVTRFSQRKAQRRRAEI